MSIQQRLDTVKHRNDDGNLANEAYEATKNELRSSYRISQQLSTSQTNYIKRNIPDVQFIIDNEKRSNTDHDIINAERELVRQHLFSVNNPINMPGQVLMVGAGPYEVNNFNATNVWFNFSEEETKDAFRLFTTIIHYRMEREYKNARRNELQIIEKIKRNEIVENHTTRTQRYYTLRQMYLGNYSYADLCNERIIFGDILKVELPIKFQFVYFCDSAYRFSAHQLAGLMSRTGATIAYGYGLYPLKLLFKDVFDDEALSLKFSGNEVQLFFNNSSENGYIHNASDYKTIMNRVVIGEGNRLYVVDHMKRFDHMLAFSICKAAKEGKVIRQVKLPENRKVVKILDIIKFYESEYKVKEYITVSKQEYDNMLIYALSIADKSLSFNNLMTWVRRSSGGFVLNDKEIEKPWSEENNTKINLAIVILFQAYIFSESSSLAIDEVRKYYKIKPTNMNRFLETLKDITVTIFSMGLNIVIKRVYNWFNKRNYPIDLTIFTPETMIFEDNVYSVRNNKFKFKPYFKEKQESDCNFPFKIDFGQQRLLCINDTQPSYTFKLTAAQTKDLRTAIVEKNEDLEPGLKQFLEKAATKLYENDISYTANVFNIWGGPGTGKTWIAQQIALTNRNDTLVVGPFSKLAKEYKGVDFNNKKVDLNYITMHAALDSRPHKILIFDEWTNIDYRLIVQLVNKIKPLNVILVGDEKQTGIRPNEGISPIPFLNKSTVNTHGLLYNFRNNGYIVKIMNELNGYGMVAKNTEEQAPIIVDLPQVEDHGKQPMFFSKETAKLLNIEEDVPTVRRLQGRTFDNVILYVSKKDRFLLQNLALRTVALSRHKNKLEIVVLDFEVRAIVEDLFYITRLPRITMYPSDDFCHTLNVTCDNENDDYQEEFNAFSSSTNEFKENYDSYKFDYASPCTLRVLHGLLNLLNIQATVKTKLLEFFINKFDMKLKWFGISVGEFKKFLKLLNIKILFVGQEQSKDDPRKINYFYKDLIKGETIVDHFIIETPGHLELKGFEEVKRYCSNLKITYPFYVKFNCTATNQTRLLIIDQTNYFKGITEVVPYKSSFNFSISQFIGDEFQVNENIVAKKIDNQFIEDENVKALTEIFVTRIVTDYLVEDKFEDLTPELVNPKPKSYDAYLLTDYFLPHFEDQDYINYKESNIVNIPNINPVKIGDDYKMPLNVRGNVKRLMFKGYKYSQGFGNSYFVNNNIQTLQCLLTRYAKRVAKYTLSQQAKDLAMEIADHSKDLLNENQLHLTWEEINNIFNEFTRKANQKHYVEKYYGEILNNKKVINFNLKDIFKPFKEFKVNKAKVGQGISAWQTELNLLFNVTMRILAEIFKKALKTHVLFNNGYDDKTIIRIFKEKLESFPPNVDVAVIDATQFDSCQNSFTQEIEKQFLLKLGANTDFLDLYYKFRNNYILRTNNLFSTNVESVKTSGEPATLFLNSVLELLLLDYLVEGVGERFLMVQGDDGLKFQVGLKLNIERYNKIKQFCNLSIKLEINNAKEFCGYIIHNKGLYLSLYRIFQKITGKHFRDYEHFSEYQISLRDKLNFINYIGFKDTIFANVEIYKSNVNTMLTIYDIIRSWAHIDKDQFLSVMTYQEIEFETIPLNSRY